eukprot:scaffold29037_cov69-Cyclotella_meneghiniana.AAC.5
MSSRFAGVRLVALMGASFFVGLQFRHLHVMFRTDYYDVISNDELAVAPVEMSREMSRREKRRTVKKKRIEITRGKDEDKIKDKKSFLPLPEEQYQLQEYSEDEKSTKEKKPKKVKIPARFNARNYTDAFKPLPWSLPRPSELGDLSSAEFMEKYIDMKRNHSMKLPWEVLNDDYDTTKLPLPIISLNFPKSATLTMRQFFKCGGVTSVHTSSQQGRLGICMMENMLADNPPMENCDTHKRHGKTDKIGFISDIGLQGPPCFYSSLHDGGLEGIAKHYPSSTILLVTRNATSWHKSIKKWGTLLTRWKKDCMFDGSYHGDQVQYWNDLYASESNEKYWADFYNAHTQKIREFVMQHPSLTYVEVQLEDPKMGELLEYYTGIPSTCVMDCHPGPKWYKNTNATSKCHPPGDPMGLTAGVPEKAIQVHADDDNTDDDNNREEDAEN